MGGETHTFINAYQKFKEDDWTFLGFSIGIKGSANTGMMTLMIYAPSNNISTGIFYEFSETFNFAQWQLDQQGGSYIYADIGLGFEGIIAEMDYYTYFKV